MKRILLSAVLVWTAVVAAIGCSSGKKEGISRPGTLDLPGDSYFPENMHADASGNLYVGSILHGDVVKFDRKGLMTMLVASNGGILNGVAGVFVDAPTGDLYLCNVDVTFSHVDTVEVYDSVSGAHKASYSFPGATPGSVLCNDLVVDGSGHLYVTDSFGGKIWRGTAGAGGPLDVWLAGNPLIAPAGTNGLPAILGVDGITWDGAQTLYVNDYSKASIAKIPVLADGSAGTPAPIATSGLVLPDGLRWDGPNKLLVADNVAGLLSVDVSGATGTVTTIAGSLKGADGVARTADGVWVSEGQTAVLFGLEPGPPSLPFDLKRF